METLYKLEPHRTLSLQGVDRFGAMGSLWGASATGFSMSGVFRDQADFAVLTLFNADDYFGHYQSSKYLPDFDFTGIVLSFDVATTGLQPFDSPAFQWIPWRSLSYQTQAGEPGTIDLAPYVTPIGTAASASAAVTISGTPAAGDRITIWYQNVAFDYTVPGGPSSSASYPFSYPGGTSFTLGTCSYTTPGPPTSFTAGSAVATALAASGASDPNVLYTASGDTVTFASRVNTGATAAVNAYTLWLITDPPATWLAKNLAAQINAFTWTGYALPLSASAASGVVTVSCAVACADGNSITIYSQASGGLATDAPSYPLTGGASAGSWSVSIDFSALGIASLLKAWLTLAPQLQYTGADFASTEWTYTVTSWAVSDPSTVRPLKIAGPGSVRTDSRNAAVSYAGASWAEEASNQPGGTGWYSGGYAHRMSAPGDSVTIRYSCGSTHNLYVGTSLYVDRGIVSVSVDGAASTLDAFCNQATEPVVTRRLLAASVAAGTHTVVLTLQSGNHTALGLWDANSSGHYFYFDYLESAVLSEVPDSATVYPAFQCATDYDTDHGYRLSPQRLIWMLQKCGFAGTLDHYMGVFWWNQRKRIGGTFPVATVTFGGTWLSGDSAYLDISGSTIGKSVFPADTSASIAAHFAYFINSAFTGVSASSSGAVLTITNRTPEFAFTLSIPAPTTAGGTISVSGGLSGGVEGTWIIDDTVTPVINRAVTDWTTDFWATVQGAGLTGVASFSMELVNPPSGYAQQFSGGVDVLTATGFGGLNSTQCTFNATMRAYQQRAYTEMAGMMNAAGLTPWLQFGEFLWWYFAKAGSGGGMAYYDADTAAAAVTALGGRALATFSFPTDDPSINSYADANFLAGLIKTHTDSIGAFVKTTYPGAMFELLWPYDVNYPTPTAIAQLGGRLNRYVNLPAAFETKSGSGLDRFKTEALAFGSTERNFEYAKQAILLSRSSPLSWSAADTAYLFPWFNGGCAWALEWLYCLNHDVPLINAWAFDHLCLLSWPLPLPGNKASAQVF